MKRFYKLIWGLNIFVAILTLLSYLAPYINPQKIWQASFLGLAYPSLLWINLLFLSGWSLARNKKLLLPLLTILVGWSALRSYVGMELGKAPAKHSQDIRLLTYNTNALFHLRNEKSPKKRKTLEKNFKKFINTQDANIVCLQEFPVNSKFLFQDSTLFRSFYKRFSSTGTILSKWPILQSTDAHFPDSGNGYIWADIKTREDTIRIFNIHLQSNSISRQTREVLEADLKEQETWSKVRGVLRKVNEQTLRRVDQAEMIARMMQASPHPVILAGDFNNTPQSYAYRLLAKDLVDSFREKGFGIGTTYTGNIPSLRLDFILVEPVFEALSSEVIRVNYSDHYPILSTFTWK